MQRQTYCPLSRLTHDVYTDKALATEYRRDPNGVMRRCDLREAIAAVLLRDHVEQLAPPVNGFLLRYYFVVIGSATPNL